MTDTNQKLREAHDYKQANGSMNCMQCVAAYMLGFPVEMVPDFALHADATLAWDAFHAFFKAHGYAALMLPSTHAPESDYLASGSTSRGTKHIVVMNDGELVFDPHPSNAGLSKIDCIYVIARQALALPTAEQVDDINVAESFTSVTKTAPPVGERDLPQLPDPTYIYHDAEQGEDDLFEFSESGAVDEGCPKCKRLYTADQMRAYARAALSAGDAVDARRYRWLREQHWSNSAICCVNKPKQNVRLGGMCPSGDLLDSAIDAAMRKGQL